MPDLAVEILSPSNTLSELQRKAAVYLQHGTALVWLVKPDDKTVEVWRLTDENELTSEIVGPAGVLTGEVLPGFRLDLEALFSAGLMDHLFYRYAPKPNR